MPMQRRAASGAQDLRASSVLGWRLLAVMLHIFGRCCLCCTVPCVASLQLIKVKPGDSIQAQRFDCDPSALQVAFVASFVSKLSDTVSSEIGKVSVRPSSCAA